MSLNSRIQAARGVKPVDLLLTNARVIDVFSGDVFEGSVAVSDGYIVGFGDYDALDKKDLGGRYLAPGLIDAHVHIESSMTGVTEFVRAILPRGTTTVVADPHEIANVLGREGVDYMLQSAQDQPVNVFYGMPSCVPATDMETAGARLTAEDIEAYMCRKGIVALGEMMNFPGVIYEDSQVLAKIAASRNAGKPIDGHAPGVVGRELYAYMIPGIASDHECTDIAEAKEKLRAGMHIMIRQGTGARNLDVLLPLVNSRTSGRMMWCTDDRHPHDLLEEGHVDSMVRSAVRQGLDPIIAIQMATLNPSEYYRLNHLGAIAPGRQADLIVFSDLYDPVVEEVFHRGRHVASGGHVIPGLNRPPSVVCPSSININREKLDFAIKAEKGNLRVIDLVPDQIVTRKALLPASVYHGHAVADPGRDLMKLAVIERHRASGAMGRAFVRGLGLQKGALASSVAHDSHNIIVAGASDRDMLLAVEAVAQMGGGLAVVADGNVTAKLALPIAGLMSEASVSDVREQMDSVIAAARNLGSKLRDPFMTLGFLALPVIPELKLTDQGLVDIHRFQLVPLFETE